MKPIRGYANSTAVIFTDGGSQKDPAAAAERLRLDAKNPPIIVLTSALTCDESEPIKALGHRVTCLDTVSGGTNDTIAAITNAMRERP